MFRVIDLSDKKKKKNAYISVLKDFGISLIILAAATIAGYLFKLGGLTDSNIIMLYIIAVLVISILTSKIYYCLGSSIVGVLVFNYLFTYPEFSFSAHDAGYPVTFLTMFITALIAGTLANKLKRNTLIAEQNAREKEEAALLAQNEQLRANMLRTISHDLRTPLTSISGNASTLISGGTALDETARQQIYTDIFSESMWLIEMVENLLYATRIEDGRMQLNISVEILDDIVQEAVRHTERTHPKRNIIVDMYDEIIPVMADANLIVQVIVNLMDNAVKYSDEDSDVTVSVHLENEYAVISVSDHGTGISDEEKEKVFDMFYTGGSRSSDSRRSLGLGLALCRSIITSHGGTISVSDNIPNGTVVSFTLPIGEVDLNE
jgi:two-component system sensor histidine kinase KdpD